MLYSQRDKRWAKIKLGTCSTTIAKSGCLITILGSLFDYIPPRVNDLLLMNNGYLSGCLVKWAVAEKLFNFEYLGTGSKSPQFYPVIAHVKKGLVGHFILMYNKSEFYDPFYGDVVSLRFRQYKIIDYRYIKIPFDPQDSKVKDFLTIIALLRKYIVGPEMV